MSVTFNSEEMVSVVATHWLEIFVSQSEFESFISEFDLLTLNNCIKKLI